MTAEIEPDGRALRAWAAQAGIHLSGRGRIPADITQAYQRAHGIEPIRPEQGRRLPLLPGWRSDSSLVVRTDFTDDASWTAIIAAIGEPTRDGFIACIDPCDDRAFADMPAAELIEHLPNCTISWRHPLVFIVDARTVQDPEHPLLAVDTRHELSREFRLIPSAVQVVSDNLNISNMVFRDFADRVEPGEVYRHY